MKLHLKIFSNIRIRPVKRNLQTCIVKVIRTTKSHHTQSIGKNYIHKLPFGHVQIVET